MHMCCTDYVCTHEGTYDVMQVQLDAVTYNVVLTALLSAEQLQASLSIVNDMHAQHLSIGAASCDRLLLLLMLAGELEVACKVTQVQ